MKDWSDVKKAVQDLLDRFQITRLGLLAYAVALVTILIDQLSKGWMVNHVFAQACPPGHIGRCSLHVLPFLDFTSVWNPGMSFGLLSGQGTAGRIVLSVFAIVVTVLIAAWVRKADKKTFAWSMGLLMAGALGNVIDRFRFGAVVDFIDVSPLVPFFPWIFNVADVAITAGATLLLAEAFLPSLRSRLASRSESGN